MIASRFAVSIHLIALLAQEGGEAMSSETMASSIGINAVIVRTLMGKLRKAGLIKTQRGIAGATLARPLGKITLLDIFDAVELQSELFSIHQQPNPNCTVGANIQKCLERYFTTAELALRRSLAGITLADTVQDLQPAGASIRTVRKEHKGHKD